MWKSQRNLELTPSILYWFNKYHSKEIDLNNGENDNEDVSENRLPLISKWDEDKDGEKVLRMIKLAELLSSLRGYFNMRNQRKSGNLFYSDL